MPNIYIHPTTFVETGVYDGDNSAAYMYDSDLDTVSYTSCVANKSWNMTFPVMSALSTGQSYTNIRVYVFVNKAYGWSEGYYDWQTEHFVGPYIVMKTIDSYGTIRGIYDPSFFNGSYGTYIQGDEYFPYEMYYYDLPYNCWLNGNINVSISINGYSSNGDKWAIQEVFLYGTATEAAHGYYTKHGPITTTPSQLVAQNLFNETSGFAFYPVSTTRTGVYRQDLRLISKPDISDPSTWIYDNYGFYYFNGYY